MDGIFVIDKPAGMTSHDVVDCIRRLAGQRRVGHAGTLDPEATGVLIMLLGKATSLFEDMKKTQKEYIAGIKLGSTTTTQDAWGEVIGELKRVNIRKEEIEDALAQFRGRTSQIPPMVSAIKHKGKPLYKFAREGQVIERQPREIDVFALDMLIFDPERQEASLRIVCSSGTYIRTLCADIGDVLGVGAHMCSLRRMRVGDFSIDMAVPLKEIDKSIPVEDMMIPLEMVIGCSRVEA
ncbi:tRNA pseudouridine(55) synthase TruB [Candidatus Desantisbacteria bacterium CG2_30_40_21]|uniref:tRNA pseudouridine synthase B n=1 Tax=Candidatus Desantisbacteria bacterium CG2_30_40_21 TaxID=1817895 RepID=A0A1J5E3X6_9BACT|nr:MAG: tRNA pseudouridine(55) synthase TruB [Candidatus Desantisbacteria bacterium CG2_30_40_21]